MITEERQRAIYEWRYPELKGHPKWTLYTSEFDEEYPEDPLTCTITVCHTWEGDAGWSPIRWGVDPLYLRNGEPNYQEFITEFVPKLEEDGVHTSFNSDDPDLLWSLYRYEHGERYAEVRELAASPDPYAALSEYLEAK